MKKNKSKGIPKKASLCENMRFDCKEAYNRIRTNLLFTLPSHDQCRVIGITSSIAGEGKTTTSINLAYSFGLTKKKVLLIDGDMRIPCIAFTLGEKSNPGLSNYLAGLNTLEECIQKREKYENWDLITAGEIPPNPSELLGSEAMAELIDKLRKIYDIIIIDLPPWGIVSDAYEATNVLDGIVMVVGQNKTNRRILTACMSEIERIPTKFLGFIENNWI